MQNSNTGKYTISILPDGKSVRAGIQESLLEALTGNGILLRSDCGGKGMCGKCLVRIAESSLKSVSTPEDAEVRILGEKDLQAGYRLACRVKALNDLSVEIPDSSLLSAEVVEKAPMILPKPIPFRALPAAGSAKRYGLAIDLGTTTIAVYLCDLVSGKVTGSISVRNPQTMFGDDVISRIGIVAENSGNLIRLQKIAVQAIEWSVTALCQSSDIDPGHIRSAVVVGNSTMIHLFTGVNPSSIGVFPYAPLFVEDKTFKAGSVGFEFNPSAEIFTLPLISGFLGSDIVAAALATDLNRAADGTLLVDIGTNGEVMLKSENGLLATSCATGPAFEGATIRHGMQAITGAIDAVKIDRKNGAVTCSVICRNRDAICLPAGICGSGVVSAVAELYRVGLVPRNGRLQSNSGLPLIRENETGMLEFELVSSEKSETRKAITLTQKDIRAVQLAKGALLAGMKMLCTAAGMTSPKRLLVAGAFGANINKKDALAIGMFPDLPEENITGVGNAAGAGAILALFNPALRDKARELARSVKVIDLATLPEFQKIFLSSLSFPTLV
jgi:uncharacterized 2Fe-2S/4Fe-4S cluster protein (DUF4445 family)